MKRWLAAVAALAALIAPVAEAAQVNVQWDYPSGATITGFKVYQSASQTTWPTTPSATTPAATKQASITFSGRAYVVVRAYDAQGESADSNILALLEAPTNLRTASQSVQFDPATERVRMIARILDAKTGDVISTVEATANAAGDFDLNLGALLTASDQRLTPMNE